MSEVRPPLLRVQVSRRQCEATVVLDGELDLSSGGSLRTHLVKLVHADPPPRRVVLDLTQLAFVDASGIAVLLSAHRALAQRGGELVLRHPSRLVRRVLTLLQLEDVLRVVD